MKLRCEAAAYSHIGGRSNNEDNFFLNGVILQRDMQNQGGKCETEFVDGTQIFAVCDGMGGAAFGEEASLLAVESLKNYKAICPQPDSSGNIGKLFRQISNGINRMADSRGMRAGDSGSTIAMLALRDRCFRTAHIGDSRVYRFRDNVLERLTIDHSQVQMLIDAGQLEPENAWRHPLKNVITMHLGMPDIPGGLRPDVSKRYELRQGDKFLVCSDGLTDAVRDEVIAEIMARDESAAQSAEALVQRALAEAEGLRIAADNITVVRINVKELGPRGGLAGKIRRLGFGKLMLGAAMAFSLAAFVWLSAYIVGFLIG